MTAASGEPRRRKGVIGVVLVLLGLPVALALAEAVSFYASNRSNGTIVSAGLERDYLLYVPASYDSTRPTPLVITLHGGAMWPAAQRELDRWNRVADEHGFIVVYPSAVSGRGPRAWSAGGGPGQVQDVRFIAELIDTLEAGYNIDPARIYANGLSNGGGMAFVLSCTLADRIAAVGLVAPAIFLPWSLCMDRRPVPMIAFHGTADRAVPYHGGKTFVAPNTFPDMPRWVANWAGKNRCTPDPIDSLVAVDVTRRSYAGCAGDAAVVLYTIQGGGHTWPGAKPVPDWFVGTTSNGVDANTEMWAFFREHQLRATPTAVPHR